MGHNEKGCSRTKRIPSKFNIIIVYHFLSKIKVGLTYFYQITHHIFGGLLLTGQININYFLIFTGILWSARSFQSLFQKLNQYHHLEMLTKNIEFPYT